MAAEKWVGTWGCSQQLVEPDNRPPAPGLANNTIRQIFRVTIGGHRLRVKFSNAYGDTPVVINNARLATATEGSSIDISTNQALTFNNSSTVTIAPGQEIYSDPLNHDLTPLSRLGVTIHFGNMSSTVITGHPGSRTTSFLLPGDNVNEPHFNDPVETDHWYILSGVELWLDDSYHSVVVLGDSITDGRGSTTNGNNRWPDILAQRLQNHQPTRKTSVLNHGLGGNTIITGGLGPVARKRFDHDVLEQAGVRWLIILEGVNDIGESKNRQVVKDLIAAYTHFIEKAHNRGILVYASPILPFGGSGYDTPDHEAARQEVNQWIRTCGKFDALIDLDAAVRDPENPTWLLPLYDTGDHLHLSVAGYQRMGEAIDLTLFHT